MASAREMARPFGLAHERPDARGYPYGLMRLMAREAGAAGMGPPRRR